jgi:hypothetical protein
MIGGATALGIGYYLYKKNQSDKVYQAKEKIGKAQEDLKATGSDISKAGSATAEAAKEKVPKKPDYIYRGSYLFILINSNFSLERKPSNNVCTRDNKSDVPQL